MGDEEEVGDAHGGGSGLPPVDRLVVAADAFAEVGLGEPEPGAAYADAVPHLPALLLYPVGHGVEWHPTTLNGS